MDFLEVNLDDFLEELLSPLVVEDGYDSEYGVLKIVKEIAMENVEGS